MNNKFPKILLSVSSSLSGLVAGNIFATKALRHKGYAKVLLLFMLAFASCQQKIENQTLTLSKPESSYPIEENKEKYDIPNTKEGYIKAGKTLKNPLENTQQNIEAGEILYIENCQHCHGENGDGQSIMVQKEKYPPPPDFRERLNEIEEGQIFHSLTYGKNLMPGNQKDLSMRERWLLVIYIKNLAGIDD
jgi:mono/diheme cytochrome c family protein